MVRSIDPQHEILRRRSRPRQRPMDCLELVSPNPSWPAALAGRANRPDICAQAIRSKPALSHLANGGRPHMLRLRLAMTKERSYVIASRRRSNPVFLEQPSVEPPADSHIAGRSRWAAAPGVS